MTIRIIRTASLGLPVGTIRTFTSGVEAALIADKEAVSDPGPSATPPSAEVTADAAGNLFANGVQIQSPVSGGGNALWANRAALVTAGTLTALFTDVGIGGTYFDYIGGRWRSQVRRHTQKNLTVSVSNNGAPKVVMDYALLQAGLVQDGDILVIKYLKERTGGTSDTDATDILLGTSPTVLGTSFGLSTSSLATTALQLSPAELWMRRESATSLRPISVGGAAGSGTNNGANTAVTVPNMDSQDTYLQISSDLTTAGGEVSWLRGFIVEIMAGA